MANWAALQEQLTGLPVAKRAKHGIHFQKGDQIEAHFVGKPCHFQENGIWKPIDTALLATADGWYSSPHSDVVINPDGRVRVKGSTYQQFTELPSAKTGKLVGDKIIRTFPGGEQWLIMKEDGFREEIHVNKQKIPVEKFIAKTTGNLPSKYKAHPITAEDAEGNSYTFTGDVAAFGAWLDKAVYPVVIDPDFGAGTSYGVVYNTNVDFATCKSTSAGSLTNWFRCGQVDTDRRIFRAYVKFDTSSIDDGATVTQVNLKMAASTLSGSGTVPPEIIQINKYNWSGQDPLAAGNREAAYDGALAADADAKWIDTSVSKTVNTYYTSDNLSTAWVNKTGSTYYAILSKTHDIDATDWVYRANINVLYPPGDANYQPVLTVLYSAGGVPKHFMHYQRMRSL